MTTQVLMPQLGESVVEGTVARWLVDEGAAVTKDEPLHAITSDKVDTEIPAPASGILSKIRIPEGQTVAKGTVLAEIDQILEIGYSGPGVQAAAQDTPAPNIQSPISRIGFLTPAVGRLAAELGVDLAQVIGTGAGGRITRKDVLAYVAAPAPRDVDAMSAVAGYAGAPSHAGAFGREYIERASVPGDLTADSSASAVLIMEADMTAVIQAQERLRGELERQGISLTFTPFLAQAVVAGLRAVPGASRQRLADASMAQLGIHIGVAVAIHGDLVAAVIRDADGKSLLELAHAVSDLTGRARAGQLAPDETQDADIVLTPCGPDGGLLIAPIFAPVQAGSLGVGAIQKRPVVVSRGGSLLPDTDDALAIRPMAYLSFAFDQSVVDAGVAEEFLGAVKRFLEDCAG